MFFVSKFLEYSASDGTNSFPKARDPESTGSRAESPLRKRYRNGDL